VDSICRIPGVNDKLRLADDLGVVVFGMIRDDKHAVVLMQIVEQHTFHFEVVFAAFANLGEVWVVVTDQGASLPQSLNDSERWGFPEVVYVLLVRNAQD
jgi:hypothetical protein